MRIKGIKEEVMFCNIGWTEHYDGTEKPRGGGSFNKENVGYEHSNFLDRGDGYYYGYVEPTHDTIDISNKHLRANKGDSEISGITVVWTAPHPTSIFGTVVVGWYKGATVYRHRKRIGKDNRYRIKAESNNCYLLLQNYRNLKVPRSRATPTGRTKEGCMGQSNVCYQIKVPSFCQDLSLLLEHGPSTLQTRKFQHKRKVDVEKNKRVEKAAVKAVESYYIQHRFVVESVERQNKGWDLECKQGKKKRFVEVKGLSVNRLRVELTPNEFFQSSRSDYRLAVVCNALDEKKRHLRIFRKEGKIRYGKWRSDDGKELEVIPTGAIFSESK